MEKLNYINLYGTCTGPNVFRNVTYTPNTFKIMDGTYATNAYCGQANIWLGTNGYNYKDQDGHRTGDTENAGWKIFEVGEVSGVTRTYTLARIQGYPYATGIAYDSNVYPMMCLAQDQGCEFEPYKGIEIPISWQSESGTLYGGYVDLVSGELVQTHSFLLLNENKNQIGAFYTESDRVRIAFPKGYSSDVDYGTGKTTIVMASNMQIHANGTSASTNILPSIGVGRSNSSLYVALPLSYGVTDATSASEWVANNPIQLVYKLATPITYQLAPQQIKSLIGRNNIWSDAGNVEVKFWKH